MLFPKAYSENQPLLGGYLILRAQDHEQFCAFKATRTSKGRRRFGIQVPTTIEEAEELDRTNQNDLWKVVIGKELSKVRPAFKLNEDGKSIPIGYKKINYHFVFDVKMDLTCKAHLVAGGHVNPYVPKHTSYSSVVSRVMESWVISPLGSLLVFILS